MIQKTQEWTKKHVYQKVGLHLEQKKNDLYLWRSTTLRPKAFSKEKAKGHLGPRYYW